MGGEEFGAPLRRHRVAAIRDLEQGRTRRPHRGSAEALAAGLGPGAEGPGADGDAPVRIGVLGPLVVQHGGEAVPVGRGARRAVLGRLTPSATPTWACPTPSGSARHPTAACLIRRPVRPNGAAPSRPFGHCSPASMRGSMRAPLGRRHVCRRQ